MACCAISVRIMAASRVISSCMASILAREDEDFTDFPENATVLLSSSSGPAFSCSVGSALEGPSPCCCCCNCGCGGALPSGEKTGRFGNLGSGEVNGESTSKECLSTSVSFSSNGVGMSQLLLAEPRLALFREGE